MRVTDLLQQRQTLVGGRFCSRSCSSLRSALKSLRDGGAHYDYRAYGELIQHCADHRLLSQGKQLHARLLPLSVVPGNYLASKLITMYSKCDSLRHARSLFDEIPHKNVFSFNAMLIAYALHGQSSHVLHLFSSALYSSSSSSSPVRPDAFSLSSLLKSLSASVDSSSFSKKKKKNTPEIHAFVLRHGFETDLFVANGLVTLYARSGELGSARKVFDCMLERDIVSWNSMISGYSQGGSYEACLRLYRELVGGGFDGLMKPNGVTVVSVLHACSQLQDLLFGMGVHHFLVENEIQTDIAVWNSLIGFYAKCGSLEYARKLFDDMRNKDEVSYGAMITGYFSHGFTDKAMELFQGQMGTPVLSTWNAVISGLVQNNCHSDVPGLLHEMQLAGFRPNSVTLSSVLPTISFYSNLLGGKQIHCYAMKNDCDQNIYVASSLIDCYSKTGFLHGAHKVFVSTTARSVIIWTAIISAYASHGDARAALVLADEMLASETRPDPVTFTAILSACAHAGLVDEARRIFDSMLPEYGISPAVEHYACMVGVLSRAGMLEEAVEFISKMSLEPNAKVWGPLLNGASVSGDVELGQFAFRQLFEIEPENTGNYIVMANIYSRAGKWEEAEKVRNKMRSIGLAKIPGCSWIESSNGLQVFVARDTSNRQSEEVYGLLGGLVEAMREEGYVAEVVLDEESACS